MTKVTALLVEKPQMTVGVVVFKDDLVLVVRHEEGAGHITGMCGLPAGRIDAGETLLDAAVREFSEETGLHSSPDNFLEFEGNVFSAKMPRKSGKIEEYGWTVFKVGDFEGELRKGNEETTPLWVSIEELEKIDKEGKLLPNVINAVNAARKK